MSRATKQLVGVALEAIFDVTRRTLEGIVMSSSLLRSRRAARLSVLSGLVVAACATFTSAAHAQATPAAAPPGQLSDADRAKRDADKVFQWIRIQADKPRKAAAAAPAEKPSPAPAAKVAAKPAPKVTDNAAAEPVREQVAARTAVESAPAKSNASTSQEPAHAAAAMAAAPQTNVAAAPVVPPANSQPIVEEDETLTPVVRTEPDFPGNLMRQLRKGLVQVSFTVQPDGSVTQAHAVSSTHPRLVQSAVATVAQWRFQPLHHSQQAVVELGFNLD
jgi:TonB family protein